MVDWEEVGLRPLLNRAWVELQDLPLAYSYDPPKESFMLWLLPNMKSNFN